MMNRPPLLIADGLIATTAIAERLLSEAYGAVQVVTGEGLVGVSIDRRPVFISRLCHPRQGWLPDYLRSRGVPYVFLLDDDFHALDADYDPLHAGYFGHPEVRATLDRFLRGAKAVWLMSEPFATRLRARLPGLDVRYVPPPVDLALFDACRPEGGRPERPGPFVIGYASTRRPNVEALIVAMVQGAAERFGDSVRFEFIGWCPTAVAEHPLVTVMAATPDYATYVRTMLSRQWSAAIAPLGSHPFENAKTNLKFREYGAARLPGIFSNVGLFSACVRHRDNGLLVPNEPTAWLEMIGLLRDDPAVGAALANQAREDVESIHAQDRVAAQLRATFADCWAAIA